MSYTDTIRASKTGHIYIFEDGLEVLVPFSISGFSASTNMCESYTEASTNGGYLRYLIDGGSGKVIRRSYEQR
jgi:hypothetical protein